MSDTTERAGLWLGGIQDAVLRNILGNRCSAAAGLAEGTNANTIKTVNAVDFSVEGRAYVKAITDNIAMTLLPAQAEESFAWYLVMVDAAGAVSFRRSPDNKVNIPEIAGSTAPMGMMKVSVTGSGVTFQSSVTDLSATGVTAVFYDLMCMPLQVPA